MRAAARSLLLAWLVAACGDGGPRGGALTLPDGTAVELGADGRLSLSRPDGSPLLTTAAPAARAFTQRVTEQSGFFRFLRQDERTLSFDRLAGHDDAPGALVARYRSAEGLEATVRVTVHVPGVATRVALEVAEGAGASSIALPIVCEEASSFLGFGAQYHVVDHRGEAFPLWVEEQGIGRTGGAVPPPLVGNRHTTYFPVPWYLDARGHGVLVETDARVLVDLCRGDPDRAWLEAETARTVSLLVFHGPTASDALRQLGDHLGRPPAPPAWAHRPWIGVQGGRDAVLAEADALDAAGVPYGALWAQDWSGRRAFGTGNFGVLYRWVDDEELYPDLTGMVEALHERDVRFLAYANPFVVETVADHFPQMRDEGLLVRTPGGEPYLVDSPNGPAALPDLTRPQARAYVQRFLRAMVAEHGIDGWMADFGEWLPTDAVLSDGTDAALAHNRYPTEWHRLSREVMDELRPDGDWAVFSRSGWTGEHGVAQIVWIGDQEVDFSPTDGLPTVVPALLNLGLSGVPFVTHDLGGFSGGPRGKEVFLRWTELAAFTPVMRTHEGLQRDRNWSWDSDEETTAHFRRFARIHEALGETFAALAAEAATSSLPPLRHLCLVFPDDPGSRAVHDQLMLGDGLLIAPVVEEGARGRSVYLPPGVWFHVFTGARHEGGGRVPIDAPIGTPPVLSRDVDRPDLRAIE